MGSNVIIEGRVGIKEMNIYQSEFLTQLFLYSWLGCFWSKGEVSFARDFGPSKIVVVQFLRWVGGLWP